MIQCYYIFHPPTRVFARCTSQRHEVMPASLAPIARIVGRVGHPRCPRGNKPLAQGLHERAHHGGGHARHHAFGHRRRTIRLEQQHVAAFVAYDVEPNQLEGEDAWL